MVTWMPRFILMSKLIDCRPSIIFTMPSEIALARREASAHTQNPTVKNCLGRGSDH